MTHFQPDLFCATGKLSGAPVAQTDVRHYSKRPKGKMGGASATPLPRAGGAAVAQAHVPNRARLTRMAQLRDEIKKASEKRAELQPCADAHASALRAARDRLRQSYIDYGIKPAPEEKALRLKHHDAIVRACERWGKDAIAYRQINAVITAMAKEIEELSEKVRQT